MFTYSYRLLEEEYDTIKKISDRRGGCIIRLLFFDMEFANGQVKGSVYSFGYTVTDENFKVLTPPTDLLISPACEWNDYVRRCILAYPMEEIEVSPTFPERYREIAELFASADIAVGFSVGNDVRALRADCVRYALPPITYQWFDMERLCKRLEEHKEAHGLDGYYAAWCGEHADHRHRSDGDAYATARLMEAICRDKRVTAEMLIEAYPECAGTAAEDARASEKKKRRRYRHGRRPHTKKKQVKESALS